MHLLHSTTLESNKPFTGLTYPHHLVTLLLGSSMFVLCICASTSQLTDKGYRFEIKIHKGGSDFGTGFAIEDS
jgi:hypothetical protein